MPRNIWLFESDSTPTGWVENANENHRWQFQFETGFAAAEFVAVPVAEFKAMQETITELCSLLDMSSDHLDPAWGDYDLANQIRVALAKNDNREESA